MPDLIVRKADIGDCEIITANNIAMALETENLSLNLSTVKKGCRTILSDESKGFYLVAEQDGVVAGQLMVTYEWSDWRNAEFWWIQSVYVSADYLKQGIYTALYNYTKELACKQENICGFRLYVEKHNINAQRNSILFKTISKSKVEVLLYS